MVMTVSSDTPLLGTYHSALLSDVKWSSADASRDGYMWFVCSENPSSQASTPVIVGEWSLGVSDDDYVWELSDEPDDAATWFNQFASAQMRQYEKGAGWIFCECSISTTWIHLLTTRARDLENGLFGRPRMGLPDCGGARVPSEERLALELVGVRRLHVAREILCYR